MPTPNSNTKITQIAPRLVDLLEYVEHMVRLTERPVFSIRDHKNLLYFEHELQGRIGIYHDQQDENGSIWLKIDRLKRIDPPDVPEEIKAWVTVSRDPARAPQVLESRMETVSETEVRALVEKGIVNTEDVSKALKQSQFGPKMFDVFLRLEQQLELRSVIEAYITGPWKTWADTERPRRETIRIYEQFFSLHQAIQSEGVEHPVEIVWGVGLALLKLEDQTIEQPLIEALVEIELDEHGGAVLIRPRDVPLQLWLKPFYALDNPGAEVIQRGAREFFAKLEREEKEFSPFIGETFEPVLRLATSQLQEAAVYHPDDVKDKTNRTIPAVSSTLRITDSWAVYARRRSDNFLVEDLERLKKAVRETDAAEIPAAAQRFVTELSDEKVYRPTLINLGGGFSGGSGFGRGSGSDGDMSSGKNEATYEEEDLANTDTLYFPKEFNESQVAIIRRLEKSEGVVVQGPPGTGKTHTIANVICHYLATGRRVLVTSKGEPALEVLRDHIPKEIRDLSISLLTSEREGLRQLEVAVNTLASTVNNMNPRTVEQQIFDKESQIRQLRGKIAQVEAEMAEWARKQLSPVDKSILGNLDVLTPAKLAERVVANRERSAWFADQLGLEPRFEPRFTDADIAAVRAARKTLEADLVYSQHTLPSPNDLMDAAALAAIHEDLVNADRLQRVALEENVPLMSLSVERALEHAAEALEELVEMIEHRRAIADKPWLNVLFKKWHRFGFKGQDTDLFDNLIGDLADIAERRKKFLSRPVTLPNFGAYKTAVWEAVERASRGERPFGLLPIGKSTIRALFDQISVDGQKPVSQDDWRHVSSCVGYQANVETLVTRWNGIAGEFDLPVLGHDIDVNARTFAEFHRLVERVIAVLKTLGPKVQGEIAVLFPHSLKVEAIILDETVAADAERALRLNLSRHRLSATRSRLENLRVRLASCSGAIVEHMQQFLGEKLGNPEVRVSEVIDGWSTLVGELQRLVGLRPYFETVARVTTLIRESGAPQWAEALAIVPVDGNDDPWTPSDWFESWLWARQAAYLYQIDGRNRLKELSEHRLTLEGDLKRALADLVKLRTSLGLKVNMSERVEGALSRFMAHVRKIGGGKGVRTPRIRRDARSAMEDCYAAVPCWIMPTWRVSESLPATLGAFDLVIVDEASQSDIGALPALLRGKKLMIVGDDKQVSPTAAFVEERKLLQLRHNFLDGQPHASLMLPGSSLYDLANSIFPGRRVMLQEHFRCVEPIIRFSFQFYTEPIIPLRIPKASERLDPPLIDVYLPHGSRNRQKINHTEAVAIVDEIERLVNDPSYKERSMGVVSLIGAEQAQYIQKLLLERIGAAKFLEHRITCGDSATFQGKERDIMFVSMVASPGQAVSQTSLIFQQRFNVALSRARDRMYLFRSVEEKDLNPKDLKAKVIAHFREPMVRADKKMEDLISLCESDFERKVFRRLVNLGYRVTPQVSVGPFRIDLVVEGANDRRLAVELDGDRHHGPERWAEDLTRQRTLERVGWRFWRCWASSFELDPEGCMRDLVETLQSQGIEPIGHVNRQNIYTEHRVIRPPSDSVEVTAGNGEIEVIGTGDEPRPELAADIDVAVTRPAGVVVELQDRVVISYNDEPTRQRTVIISPTQNDPGNGILNTSHPLAVALLGHSVDDEIEIESSSGTRTVIVQAIEKAVAFGNGLGQRNEISEQQDTKPGNNQPETSQLYGQNLPTGQLYREHGAKTVSEENQPQVETQPSETEEQHNQSPSKDMVDLQDQSGIRNTVPIEIPTDSSARESLSNTAPRRDGQTTREPNLEALDLVRRAREVIQAKGNGQPGKGSFTNQERATIKKILGMDRGDLTLAIVFLQKIELGREGREKG
jgi:very-short-patch-repair endonuclease